MQSDLFNRATLRALPVFPLPGMVQFPGTVLPLHIFEPRYVAMIEDVLQHDRTMAMVMLQEGADPMESQPALHSIGCCGHIVHEQATPEGGYHILLHGLQRVQLIAEIEINIDSSRGYRRFESQLVNRPSEADLKEASRELGHLESTVINLRHAIAESDADLVKVLSATSDPVELADILSAVLVPDAEARQRLLAAQNLRQRLKLLIDDLASAMAQVSATVGPAHAN